MLNSLNLVFNISHITQASFSEFVIDGHFYTSPNQQNPPPALSFNESKSLLDPVSPTELRKRVWAHHHSPYLPFVLNSPFHGSEQIGHNNRRKAKFSKERNGKHQVGEGREKIAAKNVGYVFFLVFSTSDYLHIMHRGKYMKVL